MNHQVDRKLYKYISFHSFVDLIQSKRLNFVRPKVWEDPYEGFIFQKLKTENGRCEVLKLMELLPENTAKKVFISFADLFEKTFYAQSWSLCPESDAMWRIYDYERKTIRIEVLESKIQRVNDIEIMDVVYDKNDLKKEIERIGLSKGQTNLREIYRVKRTAFGHEEEVRLIYQLKDAINENKTYSDFYRLDISYIPSFINSVCIHPQAPDWFNLTMKKFCTLNSQKYLGKSNLYETV